MDEDNQVALKNDIKKFKASKYQKRYAKKVALRNLKRPFRAMSREDAAEAKLIADEKAANSAAVKSFLLTGLLMFFVFVSILTVVFVFGDNPENMRNYEFSSENFFEILSEIHWPTVTYEFIKDDGNSNVLANIFNSVAGVITLAPRVLIFFLELIYELFTIQLFVPV